MITRRPIGHSSMVAVTVAPVVGAAGARYCAVAVPVVSVATLGTANVPALASNRTTRSAHGSPWLPSTRTDTSRTAPARGATLNAGAVMVAAAGSLANTLSAYGGVLVP